MRGNIFLFLLIIFNGLCAFSQDNKLYTKDIQPLFFNLDIDHPDSILSNQILNIPDFHFTSTDKIDTFWQSNKSSFVLFKTPEIVGMPKFNAKNPSIDAYQADSLFIFLGGGGGILMNDPDSALGFIIETVEIIRKYKNANTAFDAVNDLRIELNKLKGIKTDSRLTFAMHPTFEWSTDLDLTEEEKSYYLSKSLDLYLSSPNETNSSYCVVLSFSKSILK